jgi:arylsulfatase A-like enzyme
LGDNKRPNIIFLMSDQHRWDALGSINPLVKTPTLDRLAAEGVTYTQATCQCPMCVPSRNSMMYGLYASQLGVRSNGDGIYLEDRAPVQALPEILRDAGYQTAGFGKLHWAHAHKEHNPLPSKRGFEVRYSAGETEAGGHTMKEDASEKFEAYRAEVKEFGIGEEDSTGYMGKTSSLGDEEQLDGWVTNRCLDFLRGDLTEPDGSPGARLDESRPLFLYLSFIKPHAGFNVPPEFEALYDLDEMPKIPQPEWSEERDTHLQSIFASSTFLWQRYAERRDVFRKLRSDERRRMVLRYWANISWLDSYFGKVLDSLREAGRLDNAIIVYASDHGEMLGERNFNFTKYCLYDSSVRMPLIVSGGTIPESLRGTTDERPAELLDISPTVCTAAGLPVNPMLPGLDLLGDRLRSGTFCESHGGGLFGEEPQPAPAYMWRTKEWKLILYLPATIVDATCRLDDIRGELYDLRTDPHEWNNLYGSAKHAEVRERMTRELLMHLAVAWAKAPFHWYKMGEGRLG